MYNFRKFFVILKKIRKIFFISKNNRWIILIKKLYLFFNSFNPNKLAAQFSEISNRSLRHLFKTPCNPIVSEFK